MVIFSTGMIKNFKYRSGFSDKFGLSVNKD